MHSQNKGLNKYQKRVRQLPYRALLPQSQRGRHATPRGRRQGDTAISAPETTSSTKLSRLPVANHVFLGSWMVDICQEGHSQRPALQRRYMAHLRWLSRSAPREPKNWDRGDDKTHHPTGRVHLPSTWPLELLRSGKGTKCRPNKLCAFVEYPRT